MSHSGHPLMSFLAVLLATPVIPAGVLLFMSFSEMRSPSR